jgi:lysophospholipase L1-like esterase
MPPFGGADWPFHTPSAEQKRQIINEWTRHSGAFDAVIDFDKLLRNPANPERLLPALDSGDHIHPTDAGYKAMADSVNLDLFTNNPGR